MKIIPLYSAAGFLLWGVSVSALPCGGVADCAATETCIDGICAPYVETSSDCQYNEDCNLDEQCTRGTCEQFGVYCESDKGYAVVGISSGSIDCNNGSGENWASASEGCADGNCQETRFEDLTTDELAELNATCLEMLNTACNQEAPILDEVCSPDALQICTDLAVLEMEVDDSCGDMWDGEDTVTEINPEENTATDGGTGDAPPTISGLHGLANDVNPWQVADCCASIENVPEYAQMITDFNACYSASSASLCVAVEECSAEIEEIYANEQDKFTGEDDPTSVTRNDEEDDAVDAAPGGGDADGAEAADDSSDGGCAIVTPGAFARSLLNIFF